MLYGPFKFGSKHVSQSNDLFDSSLRMKNKVWGVRDLEEVSREAAKHGFIKDELFSMPANNFSVIYRKSFL